MRLEVFAKNSILLLILFTIVVGGIFFDAHESLELSDWLSNNAITEQSDTSSSLNLDCYVDSSNAYVLSVTEIKDVSVFSEVIKNLERSTSNKRIVVLTLFLCLFLSICFYFKSNLPSIFPWTNVICSRNNIITFIHDKDGLK